MNYEKQAKMARAALRAIQSHLTEYGSEYAVNREREYMIGDEINFDWAELFSGQSEKIANSVAALDTATAREWLYGAMEFAYEYERNSVLVHSMLNWLTRIRARANEIRDARRVNKVKIVEHHYFLTFDFTRDGGHFSSVILPKENGWRWLGRIIVMLADNYDFSIKVSSNPFVAEWERK